MQYPEVLKDRLKSEKEGSEYGILASVNAKINER
jgi:hypothetical protein